MDRDTLRRIDRFSEGLDRLIEEPDHPSLLHGDVWTTNVLAEGDRITGFFDPAVYYGHPEIELAFITLFSTFGEAFFRRYDELRGIRPGFFEVRRGIYNLYPLLVHVRLFGGGYLSGVERVLDRHGC
jgi:fructosamine-3-kinase